MTANGEKNPIHLQACPAYSLDNNDKDSDYAVPRKRNGSIDSVDLQLHREDDKIRGINNPLPCTTPLPATPLPATPPLPPPYNHNSPMALYPTGKQTMSLDNLSSYTNGHVATGRKESLYQSPRFPSLSVDDLLNGVPSRNFHYTFSPLHSSTRSPPAVPSPKSIPKTPKDTYDDPRTPSKKVPLANATYDSPKRYAQQGTTPLVIHGSPKSVPRTPKDAYDNPRTLSTVPAGDTTYDSPKNLHNYTQLGAATEPVLVEDNGTLPQSVQRTPEDAYDDPRKPSAVPVDNSTTYDSPRNPYNYTQLGTPTKSLLVDDKDDPDYSYVE